MAEVSTAQKPSSNGPQNWKHSKNPQANMSNWQKCKVSELGPLHRIHSCTHVPNISVLCYNYCKTKNQLEIIILKLRCFTRKAVTVKIITIIFHACLILPTKCWHAKNLVCTTLSSWWMKGKAFTILNPRSLVEFPCQLRPVVFNTIEFTSFLSFSRVSFFSFHDFSYGIKKVEWYLQWLYKISPI